MEFLSDDVINPIREKYGQDAWVRTARLEFESRRYFNRVKELVRHDRIGEVVFAVQRPNGKFIAVRSKEYPEGIFRIPTGGICHGEDIIEAVGREVREELGVAAQIVRFIGLCRVQMVHGPEHIWFNSFFFHLKETGGNLLFDATDDEVSEIREADFAELESISRLLANMGRGWNDWGAFRFLTTSTIADYVRNLG